MEHLTGTVERIVYQNDENHWTVARIKLAEATTRYRAAPDLTTIVGPLPGINVGETLALSGAWEVHPRHGRNFKVETFEPRLPSSAEGIRRYLGSGLIKGIGPKTAERIVDRFGGETLEVIEHTPERLCEVPGISLKKLQVVIQAWAEQKDVKTLMLFLQSHEVSIGLAARIYKAYGAEAINVIRTDPYQLAKDVHGIGFVTADTLARKLGLPAQSPQRHAAGLKYVLSQATDDGHVYLPRTELLSRAAEALGAVPAELEAALDALVQARDEVIVDVPVLPRQEQAGAVPAPPQRARAGPALLPGQEQTGSITSPGQRPGPGRAGAAEPASRPLSRSVAGGEDAAPDASSRDHGERVYLAPFFHSERGAARRLRLLAETPSTLLFARNIDWARAFAGLQGRDRIELAEGQRQAVQAALSHKVSVLTGGPGVGKTTTLRAVLYLLEHYGITYCLAAPTGRAAKRMSEATGRQAMTMHRLLEFSPSKNGFQVNENNPLPYSFVIADESSMIDILLFYGLVRAIAPTAHLLMVGDADQLPSVGPGNVLRDVIGSQALPVTRLTQLFRQAAGSRIITTAHAINRGEVPRIESADATDLYFIREDDSDRVLELLKTVVAQRAPRAFGLDPMADVQVISPSNRGPLGVGNLNVQLQELLNPPREDELAWGQRVFRTGDKVMQIRNDYNKNVFNGDMGRVARIDREQQLLVVAYPADGLPIRRDGGLVAGGIAAPARGRLGGWPPGAGSPGKTPLGRPAMPAFVGGSPGAGMPGAGRVGGGNVVEVAYEFHELDELVHAYAVSVHKSQGSEFPAVVMPLVTSHYLLLQRNLIYTAITRARRLCVLIGSPRALAIAVKNSAVDRRYSALAERLRAAPPRTL